MSSGRPPLLPLAMPPPSWTFMRIERADVGAPALHPAAVLVLSLAEIVRMWWRRYVG